ncbi:glycosyltransferase [Butyrivibrio sp. INlla14]|uniref:glycosyltransferase n=1 Tax=Butyrivibrio sp. INlla14 TaxID=1520808 RepID=UPI00087637CF|nr:glycosyltransferase [Butyrivibrio sp. INlla14]SCY34200.1 Spore maturation protein CgeB [Butyrivibrio sp. INlla14]
MINNKICFICCITDIENDSRIAQNISMLSIPEGYDVEYLGVTQAKSIADGYNEAIDSTDALIKIFLKESVTITSPDLLADIVRIYSGSDKIAVIGALGTDKMPVDMVMQHGIMYGQESDNTYAVNGEYQEVLCISDDLFTVKGDYRFNSELFDGDSFYNVDLCASVLRSGKKIVVASQSPVYWTNGTTPPVYDDSFEKYRKIALDRYSGIFRIDKSARRIGVAFLEEMSANDMLWALLQTRHDVEIMDLGISIYRNTPEDVDKIYHFITDHHIDIVFSFDFCPAISAACEKKNIKYASWIYDAPQEALFDAQVLNSCNYVFSFDKDQVKDTTEFGCPHVFYQPLAANTTRMSTLATTAQDVDRFSCEVSFIGSLYSDNLYRDVLERVCSNTHKELDRIIKDSMGIWDGQDHISGKLSDSARDELLALLCQNKNPLARFSPDAYINAIFISRYLTSLERTEILRRISKYGLHFYTRESNVCIENVTPLPALDYNFELPKAYALSKINLNITLHTITSGIPLRVFDIMGSGGFMLTNYQPEIQDLFVIGKDLDVFHNIDELEEKIQFYLGHDDLRRQIAKNGQEIIKKSHSYEVSMNAMLSKMAL